MTAGKAVHELPANASVEQKRASLCSNDPVVLRGMLYGALGQLLTFGWLRKRSKGWRLQPQGQSPAGLPFPHGKATLDWHAWRTLQAKHLFRCTCCTSSAAHTLQGFLRVRLQNSVPAVRLETR